MCFQMCMVSYTSQDATAMQQKTMHQCSERLPCSISTNCLLVTVGCPHSEQCHSSQFCCRQSPFCASPTQVRFLTVSVLSSFDQCYNTACTVLTEVKTYCTGAGLLFVLQFSRRQHLLARVIYF